MIDFESESITFERKTDGADEVTLLVSLQALLSDSSSQTQTSFTATFEAKST